jgi:hypothetical protein
MPCRNVTSKGKFTNRKTGHRKCWGGGRKRRGMSGLGTHPGCTCTRRRKVMVTRRGKIRKEKRCVKFSCK